jgi:cell division protein FtsX
VNAWAVPALILLALVGALLAILGAAAIRQGGPGEARLAGAVTVVVWGHGLESADAAQARAVEILAGAGGVTRATALDPAAGDERFARAVGAPAGAEVRLIAVASPAARIAPRLARALRAQGLAARAGDRDAAVGQSRKALVLALTGDVVLPLLVIATMIAVCAQAIRREAAMAAPSLGLIRQFGATDRFVRGLWRRRSAGRALACGLIGAAAAVIAAVVWQAGGALGVPVGPLDLAWAALWAPVAGLIGALAIPRAPS